MPVGSGNTKGVPHKLNKTALRSAAIAALYEAGHQFSSHHVQVAALAGVVGIVLWGMSEELTAHQISQLSKGLTQAGLGRVGNDILSLAGSNPQSGNNATALNAINGIGNEFQKELHRAGITSAEQLAASDAGTLAQMVNIPQGRLTTLISNAQQAVGGSGN